VEKNIKDRTLQKKASQEESECTTAGEIRGNTEPKSPKGKWGVDGQLREPVNSDQTRRGHWVLENTSAGTGHDERRSSAAAGGC